MECDDLQVRLDVTASQLSVVRSSLKAAHEQLELHFGGLAASCLQLEVLLSPSAFRFVHGFVLLVSD